MAGKSYGVVLSDGRSGVFDSWPDAKAFIASYPSNAKYKSFPSRPDAEKYVADLTAEPVGTSETQAMPDTAVVSETDCIAYVDGSFNAKKNVWGYGVVMYRTEAPDAHEEFSGSGDAYAESRNVTGEVYGAMVAVKRAIAAGMKSVTIYHDYAGIADWVTGAWAAKNEMTRKYKAFMTAQSRHIEIRFVKVAGHTGVELNERCDVLAKAACGVKT